MAGPQYVYVMKGLSKTYPGGKQVLKDIWLSFYPGAKIGIVGVNGAGQVHPDEDHGRARSGIHRRGLGRRRRAHGLPAAGTAARSRPRTCAATSWKASPRSRRWSTATTRSPPTIPTKPPTRWPSCRTRSRRRACGISTARSTRRWTRCAARKATRRSPRSRAASAAAWRCASCCSTRRTFFCSTNRPTISTRNRSNGSSTRCANTRAASSSSPMTAISSTM